MASVGAAAAGSALPPFLEEAVAELERHDALLVLAKGLGLHAVLRRLVEPCLSPESLVLLLNTSREEEELLLHQLRRAGVDDALLPPTINNEWSAAQRVERYLRGGVLLVTARILVVDMLCERMPTAAITGVIVANAHRVSEWSNVAFALRMYRQRTRSGFVRALSDEPGAIVRGFSRAERLMASLFVRKLLLWPRFHMEVSRCLSAAQPEVEELSVPMTERAAAMQAALLEAMEACVSELRSSNSSVDGSQLTTERALFRSFDAIVRAQLDPIWHKTSRRTRALVADLQTLRRLLSFLASYDSVTFFEYLETVFDAATALHPTERPHWVINSSEAVYVQARDRVYTLQRSQMLLRRGPRGPAPMPQPRRPSASSESLANSAPGPVCSTGAHAVAAESDCIDGTVATARAGGDAPTAPLELTQGLDGAASNGSGSAERGVGGRAAPLGIKLVLEENPKWSALLSLLEEIGRELLGDATARQDSLNGSATERIEPERERRDCTAGVAGSYTTTTNEASRGKHNAATSKATTLPPVLLIVRDARAASTVLALLSHGARPLLEATLIRWVGRRRCSVPPSGTLLSSRQHEASLLRTAAAELEAKRQAEGSIGRVEQVATIEEGEVEAGPPSSHGRLGAAEMFIGSDRARSLPAALPAAEAAPTNPRDQLSQDQPWAARGWAAAGGAVRGGKGSAGGRGRRGRGGAGRGSTGSSATVECTKGASSMGNGADGTREAGEDGGNGCNDSGSHEAGHFSDGRRFIEVFAHGVRLAIAPHGIASLGLLSELQPTHVVMYDVDIAMVRAIEVEQALREAEARSATSRIRRGGTDRAGYGDSSLGSEDPNCPVAQYHAAHGFPPPGLKCGPENSATDANATHSARNAAVSPTNIHAPRRNAGRGSSPPVIDLTKESTHDAAPDVSSPPQLDSPQVGAPPSSPISRRLHVYFLMLLDSVEEQQYRSEIAAEIESFEALILAKSRMALPSEWDCHSQQLPHQLRLEDGASADPNVASLRAGGGHLRRSQLASTPIVVVDMREFRSALPNSLHLHGIAVKPATLEVGDYILTPDIVVERKSISDLVQSLASGRLYNQAESMVRSYRRPSLLLEFDENRHFGLCTQSELATDLSPNTTLSKLCLLLIHFPKLRLLWSRRPLHTIAIFEALKRGAAQPDADTASAVGTYAEQEAGQLFNMTPQDMLRAMPGIHPHNVRRLMNAVPNLKELSRTPLDRLTQIIGAQNAKLLHTFLHQTS